jgi:hypothetical protein
MDRLIGRAFVALGGLACAQKGQHGMREAQPHDILDREFAVLQHDCAPQRIGVVDAVTGEVESVRGGVFQQRSELGHGGARRWCVQDTRFRCFKTLTHHADLVGRVWKVGWTGGIRCLANHQACQLGPRDGHPAPPGVDERDEGRHVGGDNVI